MGKTQLLLLEVSNVRKLQDFKLEIDGHSIFLIGKNEIGKSTVMNVILMLMGKLPPTDGMVTKGKDEGKASLKFMHSDGEEYVATMYINDDKDRNRFEVRPAKGGKPIPSPKEFVKSAAGTYIDIFEIIKDEKTAAGQRKNENFFLEVAKLDPKIVREYNDRIAKKEEQRLITGQARDTAAGFVNKMRDEVDVEAFNEKKDTKPLIDAHHTLLNSKKIVLHEKAREVSDEFAKKMVDGKTLELELANLNLKKSEREAIVTKELSQVGEIKTCNDRIEALEKEIAQLIREKESQQAKLLYLQGEVEKTKVAIKAYDYLDGAIEKVNASITSLQEDNKLILDEQAKKVREVLDESEKFNTDLESKMKTELETALEQVETHNKRCDNTFEYQKKVKEEQELDAQWKGIQAEVERLREGRKKYIRSGSFDTVPGLMYDDEKQRITYKDNLLGETSLSTGQLIELGFLLTLSYNKDAGMNVFLVPNASLLDAEKREHIENRLKENGMIGFYEIVDPKSTTEKITIEIVN